MIPTSCIWLSSPERLFPTRKHSLPEWPKTRRIFARWAALANGGFDSAYACIHPVHHYPLCERGAIRCYYIEKDGQVVAVAAIMREGADASLEFVATAPGHRRQGLASGVCAAAIEDAFARGAEIVTLRAGNEGTKELYTSLGFRIFNEAL